MADQTRIRPQQRGPNLPQAPSGAESRFTRRGEDPLAELARLIGQDDPFAEFSRERQAQPRGSQQRPGSDLDTRGGPRDDHFSQNGANGSRPIDRPRKTEPVYESYYEDREETYRPDEAQPQRVAVAPAKNGRSAYSYGGSSIERNGMERIESRSVLDRQPASRAPVHEVYEDHETYDERDYEQESSDRAVYDDPRTAIRVNDSRRRADETYEPGYPPEYQEYPEDEYADEDTEQVYVEPPRRSRRWLFVGIAALIGLVVLSVTALYGYRVLFGKHSASTPPTIRSAEAPNKIVPQANAENSGQKLIYDRAPGGNERVVSREEQPADLAQNRTTARVTSPVSENVQPAGQVSAFAPPLAQTAPAQVGAAMTNTNTPTGEPKRVRTMTVRSDGSMVANAAPARPTPQANNQRATATVAPLALNSTAPSAEEDPADTTTNRSTARPATRTTAPAQNTQQPWAITQQPAPTQAPQQQVSNYVPAGSYVVQVSSQKSEADAQTAWRQMQSRYTNVLGSQQATIKRVDLGDRGTFYRAMVGPFTTRDQAYEMCQNLKAAGGECVVQRN